MGLFELFLFELFSDMGFRSREVHILWIFWSWHSTSDFTPKWYFRVMRHPATENLFVTQYQGFVFKLDIVTEFESLVGVPLANCRLLHTSPECRKAAALCGTPVQWTLWPLGTVCTRGVPAHRLTEGFSRLKRGRLCSPACVSHLLSLTPVLLFS